MSAQQINEMLNAALLFAFLAAAVITDIREQKIYNWTTYTGAFVAVAASTLFWLLPPTQFFSSVEAANYWIGFPPQVDGRGDSSLFGFFACGLIMVVCFVIFAGQVGGGDVKLIAMIGAFLGVYRGLEAMMWTFLIAGAAALIVLVWKVGVGAIIRYVWGAVGSRLRLTAKPIVTEEEERAFKTGLFIAPSALAAVIVVWLQLDRFLF
ncbi:MAG: A24 family peptidase [bacterium]|nr:A24 family peptidase [bacterium]